MAELDPAHVEAVARVLTAAIDTSPRQRTGISHNARLRQARALLRSDTPAVHAALLAALVRAGVLEADFRFVDPRKSWQQQRRYVTSWEDVDA